jgi:hypothetical protein
MMLAYARKWCVFWTQSYHLDEADCKGEEGEGQPARRHAPEGGALWELAGRQPLTPTPTNAHHHQEPIPDQRQTMCGASSFPKKKMVQGHGSSPGAEDLMDTFLENRDRLETSLLRGRC